jgi:hypothetical protein
MPSVTKLLRLATLPETRHVIAAASRSDALRDLVSRTRSDRTGLLRDLAHPATTVRLVREAIVHPATRELANVGYILLPSRYLPAGWVATWFLRRALGRSGDGPIAGGGASKAQASSGPKNVTPRQGGEPPTSTARGTG